MTFVVDTNVLIYASNTDCKEHEACLRLVESWCGSIEPWYATWPIVYEYLRVSTHALVFDQPLAVRDAWSFIGALSAVRSFGFLVPTRRHPEVAQSFRCMSCTRSQQDEIHRHRGTR